MFLRILDGNSFRNSQPRVPQPEATPGVASENTPDEGGFECRKHGQNAAFSCLEKTSKLTSELLFVKSSVQTRHFPTVRKG